MAEKDERLKDYMLQKALAKDLKIEESEVEVVDWESYAGANPGENFATDMVAVKGKAKIKGGLKDFSYMTKVAPLGEFRANMIKNVSPTETKLINSGS